MFKAFGLTDAARSLSRKSTLLRRLYYRCRNLRPRAQSDEPEIIKQLASDGPRTFVEFGFHPIQFNCSALAKSPEWRGLLVDGNERQVADARALFPPRIDIRQAFLTRENLGFIKEHFTAIGVLSIDVDGNDYWLLKELLDTSPTVISVEYNATFGQRSLTVPYDPTFERHQKHKSGWYHGASLTALSKLAASVGYGLAAVSSNGANAFFTRTGSLDPRGAWKPNVLRGASIEEQWKRIAHLPFVKV